MVCGAGAVAGVRQGPAAVLQLGPDFLPVIRAQIAPGDLAAGGVLDGLAGGRLRLGLLAVGPVGDLRLMNTQSGGERGRVPPSGFDVLGLRHEHQFR